MSKRKKPAQRPAEATTDGIAAESVTVETAPPVDVVTAVDAADAPDLPADLFTHVIGMAAGESEQALLDALREEEFEDELTADGNGHFAGRDDLDASATTGGEGDEPEDLDSAGGQRRHLRGLLEALIFASDAPIKTKDLAKLSSAPLKQILEALSELRQHFSTRGIHLEEVAGGWIFRTSPKYAPYIRDLTKQRPVKLTRAQVETIAIIAYRQPVTRPEIDDVRGVDSGPVLKLLLERDLVRILGKRDEPGRPLIYGTTNHFLEFFGLKSLKDLPTLREFTELTEESREQYEEELGEPVNHAQAPHQASHPSFETARAPSAVEDGDESTGVGDKAAGPADSDAPSDDDVDDDDDDDVDDDDDDDVDDDDDDADDDADDDE